jgi:hypothetical protein
MMSTLRQTLHGMLQETALDMTRAGQKLVGLPVTRTPVPFLSANIVYPLPDPTASVDSSAVLTGHILVRRSASIGARTVLRGDTGVIDVGRYSKLGGKLNWCSFLNRNVHVRKS